MNKIILMALLVAAVPAFAGVKEIGTVNGLKVVRIKTAGVFAPSTTTVVVFDPKKPGTIEAVLNGTGGPGFVPAVATAGGIVGGAAVLRPARTKVQQSGGNATGVGVGTGGNGTGGNGTGGAGGVGGAGGGSFVPPGHQNNPSNNH